MINFVAYANLIKRISMRRSAVKVMAEAMLQKKAKGVLSLDLRPLESSIADHFVICNADSTTAVGAIAENVIEKMEELCGRKVTRMQGLENQMWVILDYSDVVAHIFLTEYRNFYRLDELWADAKRKEYTDEPLEQEAEVAAPKRKSKAASKVRSASEAISRRK